MEILQGIHCYSEELNMFTLCQNIWRSFYIPGSPSETNTRNFVKRILVRYRFTREHRRHRKLQVFSRALQNSFNTVPINYTFFLECCTFLQIFLQICAIVVFHNLLKLRADYRWWSFDFRVPAPFLPQRAMLTHTLSRALARTRVESTLCFIESSTILVWMLGKSFRGINGQVSHN
jgi:hypothetical protein